MTVFSQQGTTLDMAEWLQFYTFDAIGALAVRKSSNFTVVTMLIFIVWQTVWISTGRN